MFYCLNVINLIKLVDGVYKWNNSFYCKSIYQSAALTKYHRPIKIIRVNLVFLYSSIIKLYNTINKFIKSVTMHYNSETLVTTVKSKNVVT